MSERLQESVSVRPRFYIWDDVVAYMETLEAERDRYRKALAGLVTAFEGFTGSASSKDDVLDALESAREALDG